MAKYSQPSNTTVTEYDRNDYDPSELLGQSRELLELLSEESDDDDELPKLSIDKNRDSQEVCS
jgi:hypothetical protein